MSKFPLLRFYRGLLWVGALIFLVLGVFTIVSPLLGSRGYGYYRPDFLTLLVTSLPLFAVSLGFGIFAEIITLFLRMEDHLDELKQAQQRTNSILMASTLSTGTPNTPPAIGYAPGAAPYQPPPAYQPPAPYQPPVASVPTQAAPASAGSIRITAPGAVLYMAASDASIKRRQLNIGEILPLMGPSGSGWYSTRSGFVKDSDAEYLPQ